MSDSKMSWEEEKALHQELLNERDALADAERQLAYRAVQDALATYRWWGWTNIINTIRLWMAARRKRA